MRRVSHILCCGVGLWIASALDVQAQVQLVVGKTYSGNIKLASSNNTLYLPLPAGEWVLASHEISRNNPVTDGRYMRIDRGRFLRSDEQKRISGVVSFEAAYDGESGWIPPALCTRRDAYFLKADVPSGGRSRDSVKTCWGVYVTSMGQPSENSPQFVRDFHQYAAKAQLRKPNSTIAVHLYKSDRNKFLHGLYYSVPELEGFSRDPAAAWQKDVIVGNDQRVQYMESKKAWGERWLPVFEAAFRGRPLSQSASSVDAPPRPATASPDNLPSVQRRLEELKSFFDKGLITADEYAAKRKDILSGH